VGTRSLHRETGDADLGLSHVVARNRDFTDRLAGLGYRQSAGDRFVKAVHDVPVEVPSRPLTPSAAIDVLVPAQTSRPRDKRRVGDVLVVAEALGLWTALERPPVPLALHLVRLNGESLSAELAFPERCPRW
jgi:hypothetical protein